MKVYVSRIRENLFRLSQMLILLLVATGVLEIITFTAPGINRKKVNMINVYYRVKPVKNLVWLHGQYGFGIFISEFVYNRYGKKINLVNELSKHYWYVDKANSTIKSNSAYNQEIWRVIGSVILYGNTEKRMPSHIHVHHKWWRWCNTQELLAFVEMEKHIWFHKNMDDQEKRRKGRYVEDVSIFVDWIDIIRKANEVGRHCKW